MRMFWRNPESMVKPPTEGEKRRRRGGGRFGDATVDPGTGEEVAARETRGGDFFYRLHFDLHYIPVLWARYLVGFCAMFMLVAIITGVITHKKIFKDFFTFRKDKGLRSWLDFHNVSAVMALPYHAMITYTGIVTLMFMYLPWGVNVAYPKDEDAFFSEAFARLADIDTPTEGTATALPIQQLLDAARAEWKGAQVSGFTVYHPGGANAVIDVYQRDGKRLSVDTPSLRYDAVSGTLIEASPLSGGATQTRGVMYGLHLARFADWGLRALFFVSGLIGCLMVASGVVLWAVKERPRHAKSGKIGFGLRLVDALNIGAVAGLPIAFAAYFWGNRLLPVQLAERSDAEANVFFYAWGAALLAAFVRIEQRSGDPLMQFALLRLRSLRAAMLLTMVFMSSFGVQYYFLALYFQDGYGWSALQAGLAFLPPTLVCTFGIRITERMLLRRSPRPSGRRRRTRRSRSGPGSARTGSGTPCGSCWSGSGRSA